MLIPIVDVPAVQKTNSLETLRDPTVSSPNRVRRPVCQLQNALLRDSQAAAAADRAWFIPQVRQK